MIEPKRIEVVDNHQKELSLIDILSGSKRSGSDGMNLVEKHILKLRVKEMVVLNTLDGVNDELNSPFIAKWIDGYVEYRKFNKDANKDIIKALEMSSFKELMSRTQVGVRIGGQ